MVSWHQRELGIVAGARVGRRVRDSLELDAT